MSASYEVEVIFLASSNPRERPIITHEQTFKGATLEGVMRAVEECTGPIPRRARGVYVDKADGSTGCVGVVFCRWEQEDGARRKFWREHWVHFSHVVRTPVLPATIKVAS